MHSPRPFRIEVAEQQIAQLRDRLLLTRWPDEVNDDVWSYGIGMDYMQELVAYWAKDFNWRASEALLNTFRHYLIEIDGLDLHYIHHRSEHRHATPLVLTHGWPGSVVEFLEVIPRLTDPEKFGGHAADAFHVVCPSLPGYAYSAAPSVRGMHPAKIAERHSKLMAVLGYQSYFAQGGDWGSLITRYLATVDSEHCRAIHLNLVPAVPPPSLPDPTGVLDSSAKLWLKENEENNREGKGYMQLQSTRPQTLAYALADSPAGLCAWIAEKFYYWSDCNGNNRRDIRNAVSWDRLLANISLYYFSGTIGSSIRLYKEFAQAAANHEISTIGKLNLPTGIAIYPQERPRCPKAWAEHAFNVVHWYEAERGGHFAAMEQPQLFSEDLWRFHRVITEAD